MQVYDLALEEKLLAEIEADKKAREAAKFRAKAGKGKITPKAKSKVTGVKHLNFLRFSCVLVAISIILMYIFSLLCVDMVLVPVKF